MRTNALSLLLFTLLLFTACQKEEIVPTADTTAPVFTRLQVNLEFDANNNDRFELSLSEGFRIDLNVKDENTIVFFEGFFLVNDDPEIRSNVLGQPVVNMEEFGGGFIHEVDSISLGSGVFYNVQVGDTYNFYFTVRDEFDNERNISFIADVVE